MKRLLYACLLAVPLAFAERPASDGYKLHEKDKEYEQLDFVVHIVLLKDRAEYAQVGRENGIRLSALRTGSAGAIEAFSAINPDNPTECTIYIKDPAWRYEPEYYGHELAHCIWGRWHN